MAKPVVTSTLRPVGVFVALKTQITRQAPFPTAAEVSATGVLPGYPYSVFFAIRHDNILWLMLESMTAQKYEWARGDMSTPTGGVEYGVYSGPVFGEGG